MRTAIVGINWGDEGKGRMVDLLGREYDVVVRYQGGNNAGHTVINERGKFILNLLPSGILRPECVNVMGPGMVIDLEHLNGELARLKEKGVEVTPDRLKISDRAVICMPYHRQLDVLEEERLADKKFGSTRRGIGPVYGDKYMKKTLRMGDLFQEEKLMQRLIDIVEWRNLTVVGGYGARAISADETYEWLMREGGKLKDYICDTTRYLEQADKAGKNVLFEAQLGVLRDVDFGIVPYTSSSPTIASYAPIGAGVPFLPLDKTVGIIKAYSYRMVPYILKEHPELSGTKAITLSRQMMNGHKWNAFVLDLSFIGWIILSALTLGILHIFYVGPYIQATDAELYEALKAA